ncbi:MAG: hypothetical protein ISS44_01695 [Candidatus Omnitrophica bacterium]|nr:hypothetical protein [Candidatus Omnitrophota bacterium]
MKNKTARLLVCSIGILLIASCLSFAQERLPFDYSFLRPEPTISLDLKDANLKDILKVFSIQSGLNFIAKADIADKEVTLYLQDVTIKEAMEKLLKANDLVYEFDEAANIIMIKEPEEEVEEEVPEIEPMTKVFPLKYARVSTSSLQEEMFKYISSGAAAPGEEEGGGGAGGEGKWAQKAEAGLTTVIENILSTEGSVVEDPRTNSLIITDVPNRFPLIESIIEQLDVPVPQIMLEVEMLDVSKGAVDKIGLEFGQTPFSVAITGAQRLTKFPFSHWPQTKLEETGRDQTISTGAATSALLPGLVDFLSSPYQVALDFLKTQSETRILARPRILTLNNETAEIKIVTDKVIGWVQEENTDTGMVSYKPQRASDVELVSEGIGIFLRVTPQVNLQTREITMFIYPKISDATMSSFTSATGDEAADAEIKSTKSIIRVRDGETIVLGGLIHKEKKETIKGLPILGDIPIFGFLFRHKNKEKDFERELLIFITPHIIEEPGLGVAAEANYQILSSREQDSSVGDKSRQEKIEKALNSLN